MLMGSPVRNSFPIITIICSQFSLITVLLATWQLKGAKASSLLGSIRGREMLNDLQHPRVHSGEGTGDPLQYSCLENSMDGGAWQAAVHGVTRSPTRLSDFTFTFHVHALEKAMQPTPVFLPGESQGQRSLVDCRLWGRTESDT